MGYTNSHLEDWIEELYKKINITQPDEINFDRIAEALDIRIAYKPVPSFAFKYNDMYTISLDARKSRREQWSDFAHEVCHIYRHEGDKKTMPDSWVYYLECQANYFAFHFCIPTFMLRNIDIPYNQLFAIEKISKLFKVPPSVAKTRLNLYYMKTTDHILKRGAIF
ncbi:ImmA/IrrE family metallo-endopeptidase [Bacillus atrophaeus]|uniref:ImmA/IrrE family metallo-endopeptidase n=1 Tax=Bacillus atrophaeus TaxID=1452 RepID=UPI003CEEA8B8